MAARERMLNARSDAARSAAVAARARRRSGLGSTASRPAPARVRWDRLARAAMLAVLVVLLILYISPVRSLIGALGEASARRAAVVQLERQHAQLEGRLHALQDPSTLEQQARSLGLVRPGERPYIVLGLPAH
jgi:cell division protein FtsB